MLLPEPLQKLINAFERLPGIGPKSASRLAFFLLRADASFSDDLADALSGLKDKVSFCEECFNITMAGRELCEVCESPKRDDGVICVVEEALDVLALERTGGYFGKYHVLHGVLSPIEGIGPDDIKIDTTAMYIQQQLEPYNLRITRLARGLPVGGDLEYADQNTLLRALAGRQEMD